MKAMLLAAGEGTRLRPLTDKLPKPMIPIAGKPILQHNVELLSRYGIREIAINLHHCPEVVMNHFGDGSRWGVRIAYSYEPTLLGTAGAVKKLESFFVTAPAVISSGARNPGIAAQDFSQKPLETLAPPARAGVTRAEPSSYFQGAAFLVIYGDNLLHCDLARFLAFHREQGGTGTIALHYRDDVTQSGVVALDAQDRITRFVEKPPASETPSHWVNAGVLVLEPQVLQSIPAGVPSDFGRDILPRLLEQSQPMYGYRFGEGEWIRWIDTPDDLERARRMSNHPISNL